MFYYVLFFIFHQFINFNLILVMLIQLFLIIIADYFGYFNYQIFLTKRENMDPQCGLHLTQALLTSY